MKNKYLTRFLCISLASAMMVPGIPVSASEGDGDTYASEFEESSDFSSEIPSFTPDISVPAETPEPSPIEPSATPEPTPGEPSATPEPTSGEPSATPEPTPGEPSVTPEPTPGEPSVTPEPTPSVTPSPDMTDAAKAVFALIDTIKLEELELADKSFIENIRSDYDRLTDEEKDTITNYKTLEDAEKKLKELEPEVSPTPSVTPTPEPTETPTPTPTPEPTGTPGEDPDPDNPFGADDDGVKIDVQTGEPVYYTNMISNIHAGKEFYLDSLKTVYGLEFSEDFAQVMDEIEQEYKSSHMLVDASDRNGTRLTSSWDTLLVRNWQDILAVYIYEAKQANPDLDTVVLDSGVKGELAEVFARMNPVVCSDQSLNQFLYGDLRIADYIQQNHVSAAGQQVLEKYLETDCKLLCAVVTASKGFVRESVGEEVSEERVNVIAAAYTLVGKIGYFWGGKSNVIGMDPSWGTAAKIEAEGSKDTGAMKAYGLDCSGFVTWAVINGYANQGMEGVIGHGTSSQWTQAQVVSESDAQPGDLVFLSGPESGSDNHVGIICGQTDAGDWIAVHCSASANGVTVGEAYGAGFRYIRQPAFYPSQEELAEISQEKESQATIEAEDENTLLALLKQEEQQTEETSVPSGTDAVPSVRTFSEEEEEAQMQTVSDEAVEIGVELEAEPMNTIFTSNYQVEEPFADGGVVIPPAASVATFAEGE